MALENREAGTRGEDIACRLLMANGYEILDRNFRIGRAEIDIIALDGECLVFAEVKARSSVGFGLPETTISARKAELMEEKMHLYASTIGWAGDRRLDIIAIVLHVDGYAALVLQNAIGL